MTQEERKVLLLAGKLALSARLVTTADTKNISDRIRQMEFDLDAYDNEMISLSQLAKEESTTA